MKVGELKEIIRDCNDDCKIIIFVTSEGESDNNLLYRPFRNIEANIINKDSSLEELHFDVNINTEYKSSHFPNNLTEEAVKLLRKRRNRLLEYLKEIEDELGEFK